jgi:protein-S-isoprenylcysteine O-methyltransferase Ste14
MRVPTAVRAAVVAVLFVSIWTLLIPWWLAGGALQPQWRVLPVVLMLIGGAAMLRCVWDFVTTGEGTPAPFDPPKKLVITGLYRWVRNPMYLGMILFLLGEALLLPQIRTKLIFVLIGAWFVVNGFLLLVEEPRLRERFGDDYALYCRNVNRWLPRARPWTNTPEPTLFDNARPRA